MTFKALREAAGFQSQAELSRRSGILAQTIRAIEIGTVSDPRWSTLSALARALRISPRTLARIISRERAA